MALPGSVPPSVPVPPSVSVALATYNSARFIEEQVASILDQSELPRELVLSDDGSTDDTVAVVQRLVRDRATPVRLRIAGIEGGLGTVRNFERAVRACGGDVIALCDHDDRWHPDRLATGLASFTADPGLLLEHADARLVDAEGDSLGLTLFEALGVTAAERRGMAGGHAFEVLLRRNLATGATVLFRRSLLEAALPFAEHWVHDEWLAILAAATGRVQLLPERLIDYRQHGANQIGVTRPTLRYKVGRVFEARGDRLAVLAARAELLVARLVAIGADPSDIALAEEKAAFERRRAALPRRRLPRLPGVLAEAAHGRYARLASQGSLDTLRDLLQRG